MHAESLPPYEEIEVRIKVQVTGAVSGSNTATVSGGGAPGAVSAASAVLVGGAERFGVEDWTQIPEAEGGLIDTQAGSHPFQLTSVVTLNSQTPDKLGYPRAVALPKDIIGELPPGLIGNPTPFVQCTDAQFETVIQAKEAHGEGRTPVNQCPAASAVGVVNISFNEPNNLHFATITAPIFNMVPDAGEPARFGFKAGGRVSAFLDTSVRTGGDYGVTVSSLNIPEVDWLLDVKLSFWGVPGAPQHNHQRGWDCLDELESPDACPATTEVSPPPFLIMPTSCERPFEATLRADSWGSSERASEEALPVTYRLPELLDGCNRLPFDPSITVSPDVADASTATGLTVGVHVDQAAALNPEGLAESALRDTTVTLPEGVTLNPADADGLQACSDAEIGFTGVNAITGVDEFTPSEPSCPNAAKVATVTIRTPLLPHPLTGAVYLASPQNFSTLTGVPRENPFESLVAMYIVARDPFSGTLVKLAGKVTPNAVTGQLVSTFQNSPELPFEELELHFFGGERAPLSTPAHCGTYTTLAAFAPWSGNEAANVSSSFQVTSGPATQVSPEGTPCPGASLPFAPTLTSGTTNINAAGFSPLTTTIGREDGNQNLQTVTLHYPPGVSGMLKGVPLCPEAQANAGTCGEGSLIGETIVSVGVGGDPFTVTAGKVYLTEKYEGAPFGLSIVNPAKAGPFTLEEGRPVVVRAKIEINPITAALTVTTGNIPHIIDGFLLQIKHVNVTVNRPAFTFNPTNCSAQSITGSIGSVEGASAPVSVPFQVTNCALLKFEPKISVFTAGHASKANGASLLFKIAYPTGAQGSDSWFSEAKFDLPKQLPARLTTLQKACLAATFETNAAACPPASLIGHAVVHTQVLPVPLEGPVYFVSYGGAKFPEAVVVLQGDGVTVDLHGETFISKTDVTSATFHSTPDVPFESIEVTLPAGPFSEFGANLPANANYSFCGQKLVMPTLFKAQNGLEIHQNTQITETGCPKTKTRAQKLAAALKACKKQPKHKRAACEARARKQYDPTKNKKKK